MKIYLAEILAERHITAAEFAKHMGVTRNSLPIVSGYSPTVEKLQSYADRLGIPTWELLRPCEVADPEPYHRTEETSAIVTRHIEQRLRVLGWNKKTAAEKAGISAPAFVSALKRNMSGALIDKIAAALQVEPWELFITREEYDAECARRSAPAPTAFDPTDPSPIQTVTEAVNNEPGADVNGMGTEPDLFTQMPEEPQEVVMQEGVTYVCGTTRITIVNGVMEIRVQDKKAI